MMGRSRFDSGQDVCLRNGREIRAGRRRIRGETPGFSIMTSANEKLSRFLQDPDQIRAKTSPNAASGARTASPTWQTCIR
ncbi:unnamed protein product [Timema podura]|uniref:Uncharacterized protein n=1 Tax=Timema podura TaxID=61482 RepID=A0ABN7NS37_TIMPD|nr:unnamed protein product [Timema podura]